MSKLTVPIDGQLLRRFRLVAVRNGVTMSEVVRKLVEAYVAREEQHGSG